MLFKVNRFNDTEAYYPAGITKFCLGTWRTWLEGAVTTQYNMSLVKEVFWQTSWINQYHLTIPHTITEPPPVYMVPCWKLGSMSHRLCTIDKPYHWPKTTGTMTYWTAANIATLLGSNYQCHEPRWGTVSSIVGFIRAPWWLFCSHISGKLKNTELTCIDFMWIQF